MATLKFRTIPRGESSGKGFFISTFRFDLPLAQALEKISIDKGISLSSVINQILQHYVNGIEVPAVKPVKTAKPTTWGDGEPVKKAAKPVNKVAAKKKPADAEGSDEESDEVEEEKPEPKKATKAASVLGKLKRKAPEPEEEDEASADAEEAADDASEDADAPEEAAADEDEASEGEADADDVDADE
jgi:hypothetical protein